MYNIEKYTEGNLDYFSFNLFQRKMKKDKVFRKKVNLYQSIDNIMRGVIMAVAAEKEMCEKRIDVIAAGFVSDFFKNNGEPDNTKDYLSWY